MKETGNCSINKVHKYTNYGNNAEPVNSGRCCDLCNNTVVIPARLMTMSNAASAMGSKGGKSKSKTKQGASRVNGKKGGRPKKK